MQNLYVAKLPTSFILKIILGAMTLHNFIEMLKTFFNQGKITISIQNKNIEIKNELFLKLIRE